MGISRGPTGVLVAHETTFADGTDPPYYMWTPLRATGLKDFSAQSLNTTRLVGLPIRFLPSGMTSGHEPCKAVATLSIDCDPKSATFGDPLQYCPIDGLLARTDEEDLHGRHVKALVTFVETVLADLVAFGDLDDEDEIEAMRPKAEIAAAKVTREDFEVFYEKYIAEEIAASDKLKAVESPYAAVPWRSDTPSCVCDNRQSEEGVPLLFCGRCKEAQYCSQACQRKDWKGHKKICSKE